MNIKEAVAAALKELVLPELVVLKQDQAELKTAIALVNQRLDSTNKYLDNTNKRLDDVNLHLVDQSCRIDALREELNARLDETSRRIDVTNERLDTNNDRLNRLYEVIVRRDEHQQLNDRVLRLEQDMAELRRRLAA
jgi:chromosome segregation ATPase